MVKLLRTLSKIRFELFPYADERINILIGYIHDDFEFEEDKRFEDKEELANMLNKTYKHIKRELNNYPLPPTKWAKLYNDNDVFRKKVVSTLNQLEGLIGELNQGGNGNAMNINGNANKMNLEGGGSRRKTRGKRTRRSRVIRRRRMIKIPCVQNRRMSRMFGGAVQTLQDQMVKLRNKFYKIRDLLNDNDWLFEEMIADVEDGFARGRGLDDKQNVFKSLESYFDHIITERNNPESSWAKKYNTINNDEFKNAVDSTLDQLAELLDELEPEANANANGMNQDGGRRRKTRSRKSRNSRRRRRLSKRKSSKRK
jgi:hypothetical protein